MAQPASSTPVKVVIVTGSDEKFIGPLLDSPLSIAGIIKLTSVAKLTTHTPLGYLKRSYRHFSAAGNYERLEHRIQQLGIHYQRLTYADQAGLTDCLTRMKADIVVGYYLSILPPEVFSIPKLRFLNLHPSMLPSYRGGHPLRWMAYDYNLNGGVTIHTLSEKIDGGDIVAQAAFDIPLGAREQRVESLALEAGIPLIINSILSIKDGKLATSPQPTESPTRFARHFPYEQMWEKIDWQQWPLEHLWHFTRCRPFWLQQLPNNTGWRAWLDWEVGSRHHCNHNDTPSEIVTTKTGYRIIHRDGVIDIRPKLRLAKIARELLKLFRPN